MLAKLSQITQPKQQQQYLNTLLQSIPKNNRELVVQINDQLVKNLEKVVCKQNVVLWLELVLNLLSIEECFEYADVHWKGQTPLLSLLDTIGGIQSQQIHQKINSLHIKYTGLEQSLVLNTYLAKHVIQQTKQKYYPRILPIFIRLSSYIIEKYLQLKNQPAKDSQDRIQDDKVVLKMCEKWVSNNIIMFFGRLKPVRQLSQINQLILMAVCDVIGALLQIDRTGMLQKQLLHRLLQQSLLKYIRQNYQSTQIHSAFTAGLKLKKYNNPIKKIQIPQIYSDYSLRTVGINTQAYAYIVARYINRGLSLTDSSQNILRLLVPAVSEVLSRPYQIKIQLIHMLDRILANIVQTENQNNKIMIRNGYQYGYPIQLLLFNFHQYQHQKFQKISSYFAFQNEQVLTHSLHKLNQLYLDNLSKQKDRYIIKTLLKQKVSNRKVFLILNKLKFNEQKIQNQRSILQYMQSIKQKGYEQTKQLLKKWNGEANLEVEVKDKIGMLIA